MMLHVAPLGHTFLTNCANVTVFVFPVLLNLYKTVRFKVADPTLEFYDASMDSFVCHYLYNKCN